MSLSAPANIPFVATTDGAPAGLVGTLGVQITDVTETTVIVARTTAGITESPIVPGTYTHTFAGLPNPGLSSLAYKVVWDDGAGTFATEDLAILPGSGAEPFYCTVDALRGELGVDASVLPDATAAGIIEDAEDAIDRLLGGWQPDQSSGRKILVSLVQPWQWAKLGRATLKLAVAVYNDPELLKRREWTSISGPDFSVSGAAGGAIATEILAILDDSGLRRIAGRARPGGLTGMRPDYQRFLNATRHDGT
jgi:hypothetical protein